MEDQNNPQVPSRAEKPVQKACDSCRVRKTRCDLSGPNRISVPTAQCRRCSRLNTSCTFLLPVGVRGPRKRISYGSPIAGSRVLFSSGTSPNDSVVGSSHSLGSQSVAENGFDQRSPEEIHPGGTTSQHAPSENPTSSQSIDMILNQAYPTDRLCSRSMLGRILNDYLDVLYPLIPVVHLPSFRRDLANARDVEDSDFLGLVISMCAVFVGIMPRKFQEYRNSSITPLNFETRTEMINYCYDMFLGLRNHDYFDGISYQKWAASYLLGIAFFQIGQHNRARMVEVESMQFARLLELHQISSYEGLNCIETQLRKKGFWLLFYGYVHSQLQNVRKERLTFLDPPILNTIKLNDLMPLEVDDELILENAVLSQPPNEVSLTTGFNISSRIFWAALTSAGLQNSTIADDYHCDCVRSKNSTLHFSHLKQRLRHLEYMLDDGVPLQLRQWAIRRNDDYEGLGRDRREIRKAQFESMRANIHVTHLWLQSIISDQMDALRGNELGSEGSLCSPSSARSLWSKREDTCRQLLHVLHSTEIIHLEPNGHHLTCKVRDVAVTLLACPFDPTDEVCKRANEYLIEFTNILSQLDGSETMNTLSLQSWVDTDRRGGSGGWYGR